MLTAVEYFQKKAKLVEFGLNKNNGELGFDCNIQCSSCKLDSTNNGEGLYCEDMEMQYPEKAVALIEEWWEEKIMSGDIMPKEQIEYIENLSKFMLDKTGMSKEQAWHFAFRCWQFKGVETFRKLVFGDDER